MNAFIFQVAGWVIFTFKIAHECHQKSNASAIYSFIPKILMSYSKVLRQLKKHLCTRDLKNQIILIHAARMWLLPYDYQSLFLILTMCSLLQFLNVKKVAI